MQEHNGNRKRQLIEHIETDLDILRNVTLKFCHEVERECVLRDIRVNEIALAALTATPVAWRDPSNSLPAQGCTYDKAEYERWPHIYRQELFTCSPHSINLAELVPCPYPCGWDNLLSHSMTDAAFLASGLVEGEPVSAGQRESVVLNNDRLIKVITAILRKIEENK